MMILIVAIQIIPELSNSVCFTILRKSSIRREKKNHVTKNYKTLDFFQTFFCFMYWYNRNVQIILFSLANICKQLHVLFLYQFKPQRANPLVIFMAHSGRQPALLVSVPSPEQTVSALQLYAC